MKKLYVKYVAKLCGIKYDIFWYALKNGRIPDNLIQKEFSDTGKYQCRYFYANDVPDIKQALADRAPSPIRVVKTPNVIPYLERSYPKPNRTAIAKKAAAARWKDHPKQTGNNLTTVIGYLDNASLWLIKNGHREAGIALLTEYKL